MNSDKIILQLNNNKKVSNSYVLIREIKVVLNVGHEDFQPEIRIKIYKSNLIKEHPYHAEVSHLVKTPLQFSPYCRDGIYSSENKAINDAIDGIVDFLKDAISAGYDPKDEWLIKNKYF